MLRFKTVYPRVRFTLLSTHTKQFMKRPNLVRLLVHSSLVSLSAVALTVLTSGATQAQTPSLTDDETLQQPEEIEDLRPLARDGSILSIDAGRRMIEEANQAATAQNYDLAVRRLQEARQLFNQLSNFYQELYSSFTAIDNRIADTQRRQAFESAQLRDEATYQLALVHRAQNQPDLAVPLLVQIVRSQNPTRDLGQRAYRQLFELGFVDSPYPRESGATSTAPSTGSTGN